MKLLFDHNLSPILVNRLQDLYPDSNHLYRLGLDQAPDTEVWQYARQEGFLIVTKDADFSELCLLQGFPPATNPKLFGFDGIEKICLILWAGKDAHPTRF